MALPFDPFHNLLDLEPCQTQGLSVTKTTTFQAYTLKQPLNPSKFPASFDPFSNSILRTTIPIERSFSMSQPIPNQLQPLKSKPPNPSPLLSNPNTLITSPLRTILLNKRAH